MPFCSDGRHPHETAGEASEKNKVTHGLPFTSAKDARNRKVRSLWKVRVVCIDLSSPY